MTRQEAEKEFTEARVKKGRSPANHFIYWIRWAKRELAEKRAMDLDGPEFQEVLRSLCMTNRYHYFNWLEGQLKLHLECLLALTEP